MIKDITLIVAGFAAGYYIRGETNVTNVAEVVKNISDKLDDVATNLAAQNDSSSKIVRPTEDEAAIVDDVGHRGETDEPKPEK